MSVMTKENRGTLQKTETEPSAVNPCRCEECTIVVEGKTVQRPGYPHWWCDTCGKGPFNSKEGQRPVYRRNVSDGSGNLVGIRFSCSGACANGEQITKTEAAKQAAQKRGDMETVKELRLEIDELKKQMAEKPKEKEVFWPSAKG